MKIGKNGSNFFTRQVIPAIVGIIIAALMMLLVIKSSGG